MAREIGAHLIGSVALPVAEAVLRTVAAERRPYLNMASLEFRVGGIGRVKGGRSPAKRTLDAMESTSTLQGSGQAKPCCAWLPSPSGGEDHPALGGGAGGGGSLWVTALRPRTLPGNPHKIQ
jgi:hypothetical protein